MLRKTKIRVGIGVAVGALLIGTAGTALSVVGTTTGSAITQVRVMQGAGGLGADGVDQYSTTWATMPDGCCSNAPWATTKMTVPSGHTAFFIVTVQTSSNCDGSGTFDECLIRLTANGTVQDGPLNLVTPNTLGNGDSQDSSHDAVLTTGILKAGTYTLAVQWVVNGADTVFGLNNNKLIIERVQAS